MPTTPKTIDLVDHPRGISIATKRLKDLVRVLETVEDEQNRRRIEDQILALKCVIRGNRKRATKK